MPVNVFQYFSCFLHIFIIERKIFLSSSGSLSAKILNSGLLEAHARIMFRNEVTRLDAITAILCIESSMTTSAIVDNLGNALHSNFAPNPDEECILFFKSGLIHDMLAHFYQLIIYLIRLGICHGPVS